jgi:hypothetical protein
LLKSGGSGRNRTVAGSSKPSLRDKEADFGGQAGLK